MDQGNDKNSIRIDFGVLSVDGTPVPEARDVDKFLVIEDKIIIIQNTGMRNVAAVNMDGTVAWRISEFKVENRSNPFTNIFIKNGKLFTYNFYGFEMELDPQTGKELSREFVK